MAPKLLPKNEVAQRLNLSPASIDNKVRDGSLPAPVRVSANRVAWLEHEIDAHIEALAAAPRTRKPALPPPPNGYKGGRKRKNPEQLPAA
jgi:predicted DNA-binding transcriptional regulator AlpA